MRPFLDLVKTLTPFHKQLKGVVHVGAHYGEEADKYQALGLTKVAWFEADPNCLPKLTDVVTPLGHTVHHVLLSQDDLKEVDFRIMSNNGSSSSLLTPKLHLQHYPNIWVVKSEKMITRRWDEWCAAYDFPVDDYNVLNLDVQGAELMVLTGMGQLLSKFDFIITEINTAELYDSCVLFDELTQYLTQFGFKLQQTVMTDHQWGEAFYCKLEIVWYSYYHKKYLLYRSNLDHQCIHC